MKRVKQIPHPEFQSARKLTPLEMNGLRCHKQHTVLTPEQLENISSGASSPANDPASDPATDLATGSATDTPTDMEAN